MLVWAAAYVALVIGATAVVRSRRDPTVIRGDRVFLLTALFVLAAAAVTALRGERLSLGVLAGSVLLLAAGWLVRSRWLVVGAESTAVAATVAECAARLRAPAAMLPGGCTVTVPGGVVRLRIVPASSRSTMIVFVASVRHRKTALFRRLLAKQYRAAMPTIRFGAPGGSGSG